MPQRSTWDENAGLHSIDRNLFIFNRSWVHFRSRFDQTLARDIADVEAQDVFGVEDRPALRSNRQVDGAAPSQNFGKQPLTEVSGF
jgi:hypothetical protein